MAGIEEALYRRLNTYAAASALLSGRIYPLHLPQNPTYPAVTYFRVSADPIFDLTGQGGLVKRWIEVDSWGSSFTEARNLNEAVRKALHGWVGTTVTGIAVSGCVCRGDTNFYHSDVDAYRHVSEFIVWHSEEIV